MEFIHRNLEAELSATLENSRAAALLGARQTGKSTLARSLVASGAMRSYNTLDDDVFRSVALDDPDGAIAAVERPAVIDEIQRAPDLMLALKRVLDDDPGTRGQFLLTGSANLLTNRHVADALPGRVRYLDLWPFSQGELEDKREHFIDNLLAGIPPQVYAAPIGLAEYADRVVRGGYPEVREGSDERDRAQFFRSYVAGLLSRDLSSVFAPRTDVASFVRLLTLLSARTGGEIVYSRLGSDLELGHMAVKSHVDALSQLYLVRKLPAWSSNLGSRQVRAPKVFVADSGLAAALSGIGAARFGALDQGSAAGALLETFVVMELVKQSTWSQRLVQLYYYRDKQQREVDVVIEDNGGDVAAVEVKSATTVRPADLRGLRFLRDKLGDRFKAGVVLYAGAQTLPFGDRIWAVPVAGLWAGVEAGRR